MRPSKRHFGKIAAACLLMLGAGQAYAAAKLTLGVAIPTVAAVLCLLLLTQQPAVNLLAALGALVVGLVLYAVGRSRSPSSQGES